MSRRSAVVIVVALSMAACGERWSNDRIAETTRRGDTVCKAVEAYRTKAGKYPFQLSELQPEFLREIPQPTAGAKRWDYSVIDGGTNYWLHVAGSEWGPILDRTADGEWHCFAGEPK
jgi:hypothetical protein